MSTQITHAASILVFLITATSGCNKTAPPDPQNETTGEISAASHDPHDIPMTEAEIEALKQSVTSYPGALAKISSYRDTIRDAVAAGNPPEAHRPLDELDVVLEHLPTVSRDSGVPKSQWETVNTSAQQIRELFNQVHARIDAGQEADFAAVADAIESELANLNAAQTAH